MHLAAAGAQVLGIDESSAAVEAALFNAELNGLQGPASFAERDVFSFLKEELEGGERKYDFIVLDPPAFVKSSAKIREAVKAYKKLNEACMKLLKPGGILASSSCSYHIDREIFRDILVSAGKDARRSLRLISMRSQGSDHPVLLSMPETEYLKCAFLMVD